MARGPERRSIPASVLEGAHQVSRMSERPRMSIESDIIRCSAVLPFADQFMVPECSDEEACD